MAAGDLAEPEDEARAYLEAEPGKLRVFRCPDCEVRVAQEADLCRRPSLSRGVLAATFTRTFNMVQVEGSVCCCRCGRRVRRAMQGIRILVGRRPPLASK